MSALASLAVIGGACLDGPIQLTFERSAPWPDAEVAFVTEVVEDFVRAGALGAYGCPNQAAGAGELALDGAAKLQATHLTYALIGRHVDARAFQLLRHMVSRLEPDDASLRHMMVVGATVGVGGTRVNYPPIGDDNEGDQYPDAPTKPGFHVLSEDQAHSKARRVMVEFPGVVEGEVVDALVAHAQAWGRLVERGAFAMPLGLPDVIASVMGMVTQFDAITFEIEIPVYQASELGFDVLLQVLSSYHVRVAPIRVVTIE